MASTAAFFASFEVNGRCVCASPTSMLRRLHDTLSSVRPTSDWFASSALVLRAQRSPHSWIILVPCRTRARARVGAGESASERGGAQRARVRRRWVSH